MLSIRLDTSLAAEVEYQFETVPSVASHAIAGRFPNAALVINEGQTRTEGTVVRHWARTLNIGSFAILCQRVTRPFGLAVT
jgi:hypothetical protein